MQSRRPAYTLRHVTVLSLFCGLLLAIWGTISLGQERYLLAYGLPADATVIETDTVFRKQRHYYVTLSFPLPGGRQHRLRAWVTSEIYSAAQTAERFRIRYDRADPDEVVFEDFRQGGGSLIPAGVFLAIGAVTGCFAFRRTPAPVDLGEARTFIRSVKNRKQK